MNYRWLWLMALCIVWVAPARSQTQTGELYIDAINTTNSVKITSVVLTGATPLQQAFLSSLNAYSNKATVICDNIDSLAQEPGSEVMSDNVGRIDFTETLPSAQWPFVATLIFCGKMKSSEYVNYQNVVHDDKFGGLSTIQMQAGLKLPGIVAGFSFVDHCPPDFAGAMVAGKSACADTVGKPGWPRPPIPTGDSTIRGTVTIRRPGSDTLSVDGYRVEFVPDNDDSSTANTMRQVGPKSACIYISPSLVDKRIAETRGTDHEYGSDSSVSFDYEFTVHDVPMPQLNGKLWLCTDGYTHEWTDQNGQQHSNNDVERVWMGKGIVLTPGQDTVMDLKDNQ